MFAKCEEDRKLSTAKGKLCNVVWYLAVEVWCLAIVGKFSLRLDYHAFDKP